MFAGIGIQWSATLLGCFAVLLIPIPVLFYRYGAKLRAKSEFAPTWPMAMQGGQEGVAHPDEESGSGVETTTLGEKIS